jgi:hypothetical protein
MKTIPFTSSTQLAKMLCLPYYACLFSNKISDKGGTDLPGTGSGRGEEWVG